jgi:flagellar hook protein FlgE
MSVSGIMGTSASGMAAQSDRLSSTADNIANIATNGYKRSVVEFSSMLSVTSPGRVESGGVISHGRRYANEQGVLQSTQSPTDLAIEGDGFFVVQGPGGERLLTRSGAFVRDSAGVLTNGAGFRLLAAPTSNVSGAGTPASMSSLVPVSFEQTALKAAPSFSGFLRANLPASTSVVPAAALPSTNAGTPSYSAMTSLTATDNLGGMRQLDIFFAKSGTHEWEVSVFDHAEQAAGSGFPYAGGALATTTLEFDSNTGELAAGSSQVQLNVPGGQVVTIELGGTTQLVSDFSIRAAGMDGHPPVAVERVDVSKEGVVTAIYADGTRVPSFRIPLARVASPEMLTPLAGNLFSVNNDSGAPIVEFPSMASSGRVVSGALELSTVDLATELTTMIEAQRNYTANSRVFQTASDLMDVIVNLRR